MTMTTFSAPTNESSTNREQPPKGNAFARVLKLIHIGTQPDWIYQGEKKEGKNQVIFTYELVTTPMLDGRNFLVDEQVNLKIGTDPSKDLSTLRARVNSIDTDGITNEAKDMAKFLTLPCMVNVDFNEKGYVKLNKASVTPMMRGMTAPDCQNEPVLYTVTAHDQEVFDSFPKFIRDKITSSAEWKAQFGDTPAASTPTPAPENDSPF